MDIDDMFDDNEDRDISRSLAGKVEKQEPVAEVVYSAMFGLSVRTLNKSIWAEGTKLFTAPQPCPECEKLKAERDELAAQVTHWKANHASVVAQARILKERPDMPIERVKAYENWVAMAAQNQQMLEAIENVKEEAWLCCSHQRASRLCEALALPDISTRILNRVRAETVERCAKVCDELASGYHRTAQGNYDGMYDHMESAAEECATDIRALAADMEAGK